MKVLATTFACDDGRSGVGRYATQLLGAMAQCAPENIHIEVIGHPEELAHVTPAHERLIQMPCKAPQGAIANIAWHQVGLPRICRQRKADVLLILAGNRRLPWKTPCPVIAVAHDLAAMNMTDKYDALHTFYNTKVLPKLLRRMDHLIAVSEASKSDLCSYAGISLENVTVIHEAAETEKYKPADHEHAQRTMQERYGIRPPYMLYVSRIEHPGKNHMRLIRAFDRLKQSQQLPHSLVLAGSDWRGASAVHDAARQTASADHIHFTGFFPDDDLPDLYRGAEVFVFPSLFEGFGLPILEAMACGTPVACADCSSMPEIAGDAALLFDPRDEQDIERALRALLESEVTRQHYRDAGIARSACFSWEKTARETLDVLRAITL